MCARPCVCSTCRPRPSSHPVPAPAAEKAICVISKKDLLDPPVDSRLVEKARQRCTHPLEPLDEQGARAAEVEPDEAFSAVPERGPIVEGDPPRFEKEREGVIARYARAPAVQPGEIGALGDAHLDARE